MEKSQPQQFSDTSTPYSCEGITLPVGDKKKYQRRGYKAKGNVLNPTLSNLRDVIGTDSPDMAQKKYRPYTRRKPEKIAKDVFKIETRLSTSLHQVNLLATNNSSTITGDEMKTIQRFKIGKGQVWTLTDTLVALSYRMKNAPEEYDMKCFCLDMPAFLHTFFDLEELKQDMMDIAEELSTSWNETNSSSDMAERRKDSEIPILQDFRKNPYSKNATELTLAGTTFNFTLSTQNVYRDVHCTPKDVCFQLRLQDSNGKPKPGMAVFSLEEWISILDNPDFKDFYQQVWNYLPLPQQYSTRIEEYAFKLDQLTTEKIDVQVQKTPNKSEDIPIPQKV